jgi:Carboxypeptidase regulatory-like domain
MSMADSHLGLFWSFFSSSRFRLKHKPKPLAVSWAISVTSRELFVAASVSAESLSTGEKHTGISDESGNYALASLSPGSFEIRIAAVGFATELFPNVAVNLGSTATLDPVLRIAQASVEVTVDESPPLVRTDSAALGGTLDSTTLSVMPLPLATFSSC